MFTGLVEQIGRVVAAEATDFGRRLVVDANGWAYRPEPGASVAVNGCCLTYAPTEAERGQAGGREGVLSFDVVQQTLERTTLWGLAAGDAVNLEGCLTPSSRLGGHFVQGHVDGVGRVVRIARDGGGHRVTFSLPGELMQYVVPTGSIAVEGVSLTVAAVDVAGETFTVALIPTTLEATTLGLLGEGAAVNVEVDLLVKAAVRHARHYGEQAGGG